jgi:two-component system cell cycle sensor histidine kinase/response regulator CckA
MAREPRVPDRLLTQLERIVLEHMPPARCDLELPVFPNRADRLFGILGAMGAWISEFDGAGRVIFVSPQVESILGFTSEECLAADCIEFHPDDLAAVVETGRRVRETGEVARNEARVRHKQGHWVWVETSLVGWYPVAKGEFHTIAFNRDITELKNAEAARRESEARYRVVSQMSCDLIFEVDREGRQTYVGPGSEEIIGYTPDEVLAIEPWSLVHPDDEDRVRKQLAREFLRDVGEGLEEGAQSRELRMMEFRLRHRDGRWLWFETLGLTYPRADGEVRFLGVSRDVTERRLAEQARAELEERMRQAQKLESLGVLAGGIAHDFNNLLTPILGGAGLTLRELSEDEPARVHLQKIQQAARRAAALIDQMLAYAGQEPPHVERLNLSRLVGEMQELVASSISGKATLDLQLETDLPAVEAEAGQLSQVVVNLITNAAEALTEGAGRITLRTGVVHVDAPPTGALFAETMASGPYVYFEVTDDGCGMDSATCDRIFDPFFTTKFTGRGLGLAAVAGIVRGHRGAIQVESRPGRGSRFRVLLPAAGAAPQPAEEQTPIEDWRATGTALVIDDDEAVRELTEAVLRRAGMTVLTACDGHEGVKLFGLHADDVRVVLLDRTMPALSGADTLEAIRELRPDAKIVLVSGYLEDRVTRELTSRGISAFLKKPFSPETLLTLVRDVIEAAARF